MRFFSKLLHRLLKVTLSGGSFADSKVGVWHWDIRNNLFSVNSFWYEKLGYDKNITKVFELLTPLIHPDDIEGFNNSVADFISPGNKQEFDYELRFRKNDGSWLWVYLNGKITVSRNNHPEEAEGVILDITRQKKIESELQSKNSEIEALYEESEAQNEEMAAMMDELHINQLQLEETNSRLTMSEAKFRDIFEKSPIGIIQSKPDGTITSVNQAFCRTFGYSSPEELMSEVKSSAEFYKDQKARVNILAASMNESFVFTQDLTGSRRDGGVVYANVYLMRLTDRFTGEDYLTTFVEDITELKKSQLERNLFFNNTGDLMLVHSVTGRIRQANSAWEDILGWTPDELKLMNLGDILHPEDLEKTREFGRLLQQKKTRMHITNRYRTKTGSYRIIRWVSILFDEEKIVFSSGRDETERYEAEMELQKMWDRLELALQSGAIGLWDFNIRENTITTNSNMADIIGFNRLDNADIRWREYIHEDDFNNSIKAMNDLIKGKKENYITEQRMKHPDGSYKWFFSRGKIVEYDNDKKPVRIAGSLTDITEQKEAENRRLALEHQMLQAQKLESLGLLAGGIAHDFNNLLTGILGNADMLLYELPEHIPVQQKLIDIRKAAKKASELTKQMLAYSGRTTFSNEIIDLNELIRDISSLIEISVSKKISICYNLSDELPCITGDSAQLSQILMNLALNASESIEHSGEIHITSSLKNCESGELDSLTINQNLEPGEYVVLEVSDNGCGIQPDKLKQIFDPFYTTKFTGRGLGLAAVSGIIRSHNAGLLVTSIVDEGTTFRIFFPASGLKAPDRCVEDKKPVKTAYRDMTILVADDEQYIRNLTSRMLKTAGFDILLAENGIEAINIFKENRSKIGCIILDLTMPAMDGHEALIKLREIDNKVPIIITSGYSELDINSQFEGEKISGFLQKPYQFEDILNILDRVIDASKAQ